MEQKSSSIAPGYCIAQQTGSLAFHANYLFGGKPSEAARFLCSSMPIRRWFNRGKC